VGAEEGFLSRVCSQMGFEVGSFHVRFATIGDRAPMDSRFANPRGWHCVGHGGCSFEVFKRGGLVSGARQ